MNDLKEGVSLRKIHSWLIIIVVLLSGLLIYTTYRVTNSFMHVKTASEENIALGNAVHGLMDASDYLTEMVQRFAVTGDSRFMEQYYFEAFASKRREQALAELQKNQNAAEVLEHLQEAMRHSVKLMDREYYAMRLVVEAKGLKKYPDMLKGVTLNSEDTALSPEEKMRRARDMVLGEDYYVEKNRIRSEVQKSVRLVEKMTETAQTEAMVSYQIELNLARAGIVLNILAILFVVWLTSSLGINPILKAVDQIKADSPIQENGADEFRYLAKAYNNLYSVYKKSIEHLNFKASHDELTGAYNRAGFDLLLSGLDMNTTYLLSFDVDDFKAINDTYGHDIGDKVLQKVVQVLKGSFRSDDYVCRTGGDEFVVFMVHTNELQRKLIKAKMEQISQELANTDDGLPKASVSVGIVHGSQATDTETVLKMGDAAMYESKKHGKNTFTFYS